MFFTQIEHDIQTVLAAIHAEPTLNLQLFQPFSQAYTARSKSTYHLPTSVVQHLLRIEQNRKRKANVLYFPPFNGIVAS